MGQAHSAPTVSCCNGSATVRTRLDRHTYAAGDTVTGVLYLHIAQEVVVKHVEVKVKREEQGSSRAVAEAAIASQAAPSTDWALVTVERVNTVVREQKLAAGTYAYPISLQLPSDAPPSFFVKREASEQHVSLLYWLEAAATMDTPATDPTICDETLITLLPSSQPQAPPQPSDIILPLDQQPKLMQQQLLLLPQEQGHEGQGGVRALVQPSQQQSLGGFKRQTPLSGSGIVAVPGTCFGSRGAVSVEVQGPSTMLWAGRELRVTLQVKNQSAVAITRLSVEVHQCGGVAEGYAPLKAPGKGGKGASPRKMEVSRHVVSAEGLPGLAAGECRQGTAAVEATVEVPRRLQGCVSGQAVRMYYALVVKAVAANGQVLELLRVPLQAEDAAATDGGDSSKATKLAA